MGGGRAGPQLTSRPPDHQTKPPEAPSKTRRKCQSRPPTHKHTNRQTINFTPAMDHWSHHHSEQSRTIEKPSPCTAYCFACRPIAGRTCRTPPNQYVSIHHGKPLFLFLFFCCCCYHSAIILRIRYDAGSGGAAFAFGTSRSSSNRCTRSDGALQNRDAGYIAEPHWGCNRTLQLPAFITYRHL